MRLPENKMKTTLCSMQKHSASSHHTNGKRAALLGLLLFFLSGAITLSAQGIVFEKTSFAEALAKAKQSDKLLFIDFHAVWCGPCRMMERDVFPLPKVGAYYNEHFVNLEIDGEKGEGIELVKKYGIENYPTFLFLNGDGEVVYRFLGARGEKELLEEARRIPLAMKYGGWDNFVKQYESGNASPQLIWDYYETVHESQKPPILVNYLKALPDDDLLNIANGKLISQLSAPDVPLYERILSGLALRKDTTPEYAFSYIFPVQWNLSLWLKKSIDRNDTTTFEKLLHLQQAARPTFDKTDNDFHLLEGRGLLFASPSFLRLTRYTTHEEHFDLFRPLMRTYMDSLMTDKGATALLEKQASTLKTIKETPEMAPFFFSFLSEPFDFSAQQIVKWVDFYWRNMPSTPEVKTECRTWLNFLFRLNPYSATAVSETAKLLHRLGDTPRAIEMLNTSIDYNKTMNPQGTIALKRLEITKRDIQNNK